MAFREVAVTEIREVLRAWLAGAGLRQVAAQAGVDRKTARRYVTAAVEAGMARDGGLGQLTDGLAGQVAQVVRPVRPGGHGRAWEQLEARREQIAGQVKAGLSVVKIGVLLERQGVVVPYRTLHRFCVERCGFGRTAATVRVADGEPGMECQLDFGYLGLLFDPVTGRQRKVHALIFTACYSRHMFVWLSLTQTLAALVAGCEAAWVFFGGVFKVLIPDNASAIVAAADAVNPRFTAGWLDYAQHCGFATDPARVRSPKDKPRVERVSKPPRLQHAQSRLLDPRTMADVERGSDLVRVRASLRPDERADQRMSKRNPVDRGVFLPGMGGTRPSARFFTGDLQLDDRDHVASQDGSVDADPRDLYRLVIARLEPEFLVEPSDGEAINVLRRPRPIRIGLLHGFEDTDRPPPDRAVDRRRPLHTEEFVVLGRQDDEVHRERRRYGRIEVSPNILLDRLVALVEQIGASNSEVLDRQYLGIRARDLADPAILRFVGLAMVDAEAGHVEGRPRGLAAMLPHRVREHPPVNVRLPWPALLRRHFGYQPTRLQLSSRTPVTEAIQPILTHVVPERSKAVDARSDLVKAFADRTCHRLRDETERDRGNDA